jgi:hypothetical protein
MFAVVADDYLFSRRKNKSLAVRIEKSCSLGKMRENERAQKNK